MQVRHVLLLHLLVPQMLPRGWEGVWLPLWVLESSVKFTVARLGQMRSQINTLCEFRGPGACVLYQREPGDGVSPQTTHPHEETQV